MSRRDLAKRTTINEQTLLDHDDLLSDDGATTVAQLVKLAAALDLTATDLLRTEERDELRLVAHYAELGRRPYGHPFTRFRGTAELDRHHDAPAEHTGTARALPAEALVAALHIAGTAVDIADLANALHAAADDLLGCLPDAIDRLAGTGLRLRVIGDQLELTPASRVLSPQQRHAIRTAAHALALDPESAALLQTLATVGPLRLDQLHPQYHQRISELEQLRLVQRLGLHYTLTEAAAATFDLLKDPQLEPSPDGPLE